MVALAVAMAVAHHAFRADAQTGARALRLAIDASITAVAVTTAVVVAVALGAGAVGMVPIGCCEVTRGCECSCVRKVALFALKITTHGKNICALIG